MKAEKVICGYSKCVVEIDQMVGMKPKLFCSKKCKQADYRERKNAFIEKAQEVLQNNQGITPEGFVWFGKSKGVNTPNAVSNVETSANAPKTEDNTQGGVGVMGDKNKGENAPKNESKSWIQKLQDNVNANRHPLWKEGDPSENSIMFMRKYDCSNYKELEEKKKK